MMHNQKRIQALPRIALLGILTLSALMIFISSNSLVSAGTYSTIVIDGNLSDWENVPIFISDISGDVDTNIWPDVTSIKVANDNNNIYILAQFAQVPEGLTSVAIFLDTDLDAATGCNRGTIGAEYGITLIMNWTTPEGYIGDARNCSWSDDFPGTVDYAVGENFLEASIYISTLEVLSPGLTAFDLRAWNDFTTAARYSFEPSLPVDRLQVRCDVIEAALQAPAGMNLIVGSGANDLLTGTEGPDVLLGLGGNDEIHGLGGNDLICGGSGEDDIHGGEGHDALYNGRSRYGPENMNGGPGNDTMVGIGSVDMEGGPGNDRLTLISDGLCSSCTIATGGPDNDILNARDASMVIMNGDSGDDVLLGSPEFDVLEGGSGNDRLDDNGGNDWLIGGLGDDVLNGGPDDNDFVIGGYGNDIINGGGGNDILDGDEGNDVIDGGPGIDIIDGGDDDDLCHDDGNDELVNCETIRP
ncbi:MAG: calcium-binding protein [Chloroflexi bacterium]|nr:calcium-binding protein [Chloroflexota bacterium]